MSQAQEIIEQASSLVQQWMGEAAPQTPIPASPLPSTPVTTPSKTVSVTPNVPSSSSEISDEELRLHIQAARQMNSDVLRAWEAIQSIETHAKQELEFTRMAPSTLKEAAIQGTLAQVYPHTSDEPAYIAAVLNLLLESA